MRFKARMATLVAIGTLLVGGVFTGGAPSANASPYITGKVLHNDGYTTVQLWNGADYAGYGMWHQDDHGVPGDAMKAADILSDGAYIVSHLSTGRVASTAGHNAVYETDWVTGDLPEDQSYTMWVCLVLAGGTPVGCTGKYTVSS